MAGGFSALLLPALLLLTAEPPAHREYTFQYDHEAYMTWWIDVDLDGRWSEGDTLYVNHIPIRLGPPGHYWFRLDRKRGLIYRMSGELTPTQIPTRDLAGVRVDGDTYRAFTKLDAATLESVRGVLLSTWSPKIATQLEKLDVRSTVIEFEFLSGPRSGRVPGRSVDALPALPRGTRHVQISPVDSIGFSDWARLRDLSDLRSLGMRFGKQFDVNPLLNARELRVLRVTTDDLTGLETLRSLPKLEVLDLEGNKTISNVDFIRGAPALRLLDLTHNERIDLQGIDTCPNLEEVRLDGTPIAALPDAALPKLKKLSAIACGLDPASVERFRSAHPAAIVDVTWTAPFRRQVDGVNRVRVRAGGMSGSRTFLGGEWRREGEVLFESRDVPALLATIEFDEGAELTRCRCIPDATIEFLVDDELRLALDLQSGNSTRGVYGWPGDAQLTNESRLELKAWLSDGIERESEE